jgi:hypothetical protein
MASSDILRQMINEAPEQVENIENSIGQIEALVEELDEQIDGLENGMCAVAQSNLTDYMNNTKVPELELIHGETLVFTPGPNYGTINYTTGGLTDWTVLDTTSNVVYAYNGIGWDSDTTITKYINDFEFANDYLTRPLTSGASYGLKPSRTNYLTAKALLQDNADKVADSETSLEDYAS